ncbi:hypothetical protein WJX77_006650 [Trebouxia sp. C0004]
MIVTTSLGNFAARARLDMLVKDLPEYLAEQHQLVRPKSGYITPARVEFTTCLYGVIISQMAAPLDYMLADLLEQGEQKLLVQLYYAQDLASEAVGPDPAQPINRSRSGSQQPIQLTLPVGRLVQQKPGSNQRPRAPSQEQPYQLPAPQEQPATASDGLAGMDITAANPPTALATAAAGDQLAATAGDQPAATADEQLPAIADDQPAAAADDQPPVAVATIHQQPAVAAQQSVRNKRLRETGITVGEQQPGACEREPAARKSRKQRKGADATAEQLDDAQQPAASIDETGDAHAVLASQSAGEPLPDAAAAEHVAVPTTHDSDDVGIQDAATAKKLRKEEKKAAKRAWQAAEAAAAEPSTADVVFEADAPALALAQAAEPAVSQGHLDHPSSSKEAQDAGAEAEGTAAAGPVPQATDGVAVCSQPAHQGEQPKKKKKKQKHSHRCDAAAAAGTSAEPVGDALAGTSVPAAPSPQVAAEAAAAKAAKAATNTAAATADAGPATSLATDKQSVKDSFAKDLLVGTSRANEAAPAAGTSKPQPGQNQCADAAATLEVVADAEPASFTIRKPARQKKRKSSASDSALLSTPDARAGTSTGLEAVDQDGATAATASDQEAADVLTAAQPITQKRHRLSHSTGPEDVPAADLAAALAEKPKLKKKERKSAQAAAADTFPAESFAVAGQADVPVPETATAIEPNQALAPEGAPVFQRWLTFPELAALHGMPEMAQPGYFSDRLGVAEGDDAGACTPAAGEAGVGEAKPAAEEAAAKPPKATKRRKQSNSKVSKADQQADDATALTLLQGTSAAKATLVKPSCQDEPMEQPAGAASASEISASSAEEARQQAARVRKHLIEAAIIFGGRVQPELEELDRAEEEAMARRTFAQANNSNGKAGIKVPSSDGQAGQQALTSSKGNASVKTNAANLSQEPAATTAAVAKDQADVAAPGSAAKAAVAEAFDSATAPRSSKSAAEKQKRTTDQAGTSGKADAPAQAKNATPSARMDKDEKKKKSKKCKADQAPASSLAAATAEGKSAVKSVAALAATRAATPIPKQADALASAGQVKEGSNVKGANARLQEEERTQDVEQEPPVVQRAVDKAITASPRAQSAAKPIEKHSPADAFQRTKLSPSAGNATEWKTRSRPNTGLNGMKGLVDRPAANDSGVGGLAARVAGADAVAMMPPIPVPPLTGGTHPKVAADGDPSSSNHGKQKSGNDAVLAQAGGRSQKAGAGLKGKTQAKQVTSEAEGANQSELKNSPASSYSSDDSSSVDSSDSEEEEVAPTQVVSVPEVVKTPGPSATSLSSSDDSSVDSESSTELQADVPTTQDVVAENGGDDLTEAEYPPIDPNNTPKASSSSDTGSGSTGGIAPGQEEQSPAQLDGNNTGSRSDDEEEDDSQSPTAILGNEARSRGIEHAEGVQAEEQQEATGVAEEGSASDEEDKQEGRSSDEEAGHAGAQANIVPESPCPGKRLEVLLSPAPSKRRSKPTSPGQEAFVEADDDELLQEVACRPWVDWGRAAKLSSVVKRALKLCINKQRLLSGEKPVHQLYTEDLQPEWWPMPEWSTHQTDRKADCQKVYEALQQHLKATGMHHD